MAKINHHNFDYDTGPPNIPYAIGDRYYTQDLARDYWSKIDDSGIKVASGYESFPVLIKDSNMTKGTNWDDLDIPIAKGIVEYEVDIPNSYAALPPTVTQQDIYVRIETTAETDFDISGATLDGVTTNYVKVTYNETDGSSRLRVKKAGSYVYEKAVSYTITVSSVAPTNKDLVLGTVVGDGATFLTIVSYPKTRHYNASFDYVVSTQEEFNIIIDRTAANQYRIKDNIKSVYVKFLTGGYQMTGATAPLQGGDAYGYIETNDCTKIIFEPGAFIDMHQNIGYLEVDTDYCFLENVSIQGDKGAASAIQRSFQLNANYAVFNSCTSYTRSSNTTMKIFEGSATALHNETSSLISCKTHDITSSSGIVSGFEDLYNLSNCLVYDIDNTGGSAIGFVDCFQMSNCFAKQLDGTSFVYGYDGCDWASNSLAEDIDSSGAGAYGFYRSNNITGCKAIAITGAVGSNTYGFNMCYYASSCHAEDIDSGGGAAYNGFQGCRSPSSCYATDCKDGFASCSNATNCRSENNDNYGYDNCHWISSCYASGNGSHGFNDCNYASSCGSTANTLDGFSSCDFCIGCQSTNNTRDGFRNCNSMGHCRSTGNGGVNYNICFADFAATQATADTAAGGWNA